MSLSDKLAEDITRRIFELGSDKTPCQRIQFMGGSFPENEIPQGGLGREPFKKAIKKAIERSLWEIGP